MNGHFINNLSSINNVSIEVLNVPSFSPNGIPSGQGGGFPRRDPYGKGWLKKGFESIFKSITIKKVQ